MEHDEQPALRDELARLSARVSNLERLMREHLYAERPARPQAAPYMSPPPSIPVSPPPSPAPSPPAEASPAPSRISLEEVVGGNYLAKIGAVALTLGIAFFLKYAIENQWITEPMRVGIGALVGLCCIYAGGHFRKKDLNTYAAALVGAGIAILYFTVYAAFAIYSLIPQALAFGFMVVVTVAAIAHAVRYNSISIAILGIIGGFTTPVILHVSAAEAESVRKAVQTLAYIAILDLGILGITYYRDWRSLNLLSFLGTVLFFGILSSPLGLGTSMLYLTLFFVIFVAQSIIQNVVAHRSLEAADILLALATPALYFLTSYLLLSPEYRVYLGLFAAGMASLYLLLTGMVRLTDFEDRRLRLLFLGVATTFLVIVVPIQLRHIWIPIGWAGQAAILAGMGFYLRSERTRHVAMGLLGLASAYLLIMSTSLGTQDAVLANRRFVAFLFVTAMTVLKAWLYRRYSYLISGDESAFPTVLGLFANFLLIWALSLEALDWGARVQPAASASMQTLALSTLWTVYGLLLLAAGIIGKYRSIRLMGISLLGLVIAKSFLVDVWTLERTDRIIAFLGLGVALLAAAYAYQAYRDRIMQLVGREETGHEE